MNTTGLLIIGSISIVSVAISFICGVIFAVGLINEIESEEQEPEGD